MIPGGIFVGIETLLLIARAVVAVLFGHAIYALREEYGESTVTVQEANELQQAIDALASELTRTQQDCQQRIEQCSTPGSLPRSPPRGKSLRQPLRTVSSLSVSWQVLLVTLRPWYRNVSPAHRLT
jgi:hypothetical protein